MEIRILEPCDQHLIYPEVLELLQLADGEFVPPLSSRTSTTQADLSGGAAQQDGVGAYFEELKSQRFAAAMEDGRLLGFVSYRENETGPHIPPQELPNIYISTLIVHPKFRGRGITTALYEHLFSCYEGRRVFTRTWSQNAAHIKILERFGFLVTARLPDHRGPGIDTLYFEKVAFSTKKSKK